MISSETINDYLTRLASRQPTPGGGAAAALHAAQGAALVAMVARYTTGAKYEQHAALVQAHHRGRRRTCRSKPCDLADADEQAFQAVIDSYKLPSGHGGAQGRTRGRRIQDALDPGCTDPGTADQGLRRRRRPGHGTVRRRQRQRHQRRRGRRGCRPRSRHHGAGQHRHQRGGHQGRRTRALLAQQTDGIEEKVVLAADCPREARPRKDPRLNASSTFRQAAGRTQSNREAQDQVRIARKRRRAPGPRGGRGNRRRVDALVRPLHRACSRARGNRLPDHRPRPRCHGAGAGQRPAGPERGTVRQRHHPADARCPPASGPTPWWASSHRRRTSTARTRSASAGWPWGSPPSHPLPRGPSSKSWTTTTFPVAGKERRRRRPFRRRGQTAVPAAAGTRRRRHRLPFQVGSAGAIHEGLPTSWSSPPGGPGC